MLNKRGAQLLGGMTLEAKTTKKKSKARASQSSNISNPAGHTYKCKFPGFSFTLV